MKNIDHTKKKLYRGWAIVLSVLIPLTVAALFGIKIEGYDFSFLPPVYAGINGLTAFVLLGALMAIRRGNVLLHRTLIGVCLFLSIAFLGMYVLYHITSDSTPYGGTMGNVYYPLLISHIFLSVAVVPLVLFTLLRALLGEFERHKRMARFTFPIWLYVAISGVVVYLMISPYY